MKINVHAGHNPDGKVACGACGIIKESTEARTVKAIVINSLRALGHEVYDCTCDNGTSQGDVLNKIVAKCNEHTVDLDVSIHFNAGGGHGTEVLLYDISKNSPVDTAENICSAISQLGFRNRGIKTRPELSVLCRTKAPALLIECCFVDSDNDCRLYSPVDMANAIVRGITGEDITLMKIDDEIKSKQKEKIYRVQVGAFKSKENANNFKLFIDDLFADSGYTDLHSIVVEVEK